MDRPKKSHDFSKCLIIDKKHDMDYEYDMMIMNMIDIVIYIEYRYRYCYYVNK